jgi:predicted secreted protein
LQPQYQSADVDLDSGDDEDSINIAVGETISIILESNSSTGYKWILDTNLLDSAIVSNTSNKYFSGVTSLVGAVGTEQWIFEGEAIGTTTIKLNYKRIWETSIEDTFEIEVTVD